MQVELPDTNRLDFSRPSAADIDAIYAIHRDPRTCTHNPGDALTSRDEAERLLQRWDAHWNKHGFGYLTLRLSGTGTIIGFCGFKFVTFRSEDALNLFCRLDPDYWASGFGSEGVSAVIDYAVDQHPEIPLLARVRPANTAAQRLVANLGMVKHASGGDVGDDGYEDIYMRRSAAAGAHMEEVRSYTPLVPEPRTSRLHLKAFVPTDAPYLHAIVAEQEGPTPSLEAIQARIDVRIAEAFENGIHFYAIRLRDREEMFGYCGLLPGRTGIDEPEIAYEVLSRMRNEGYATEAAQAVIPAARATGRRRLWSTVRAWNDPSLRVLEKNGFTRDHSRFEDSGELVYLRLEL